MFLLCGLPWLQHACIFTSSLGLFIGTPHLLPTSISWALPSSFPFRVFSDAPGPHPHSQETPWPI